MRAYELEPKDVFSSEQWIAIAQSIKCAIIPDNAKQEICEALFEYTINSIKPEKAERFVEEVRKFRASASGVRNFVKNFGLWHDKIEDLHKSHVWDELREVYSSPKFNERAFISAGVKMLDGVKVFWDGLNDSRRTGGRRAA